MSEVSIQKELVITKKVVLEMTMNEAIALKAALGNIRGDMETTISKYTAPMFWKLDKLSIVSIPDRYIPTPMECADVPGIDNLSKHYKKHE